METYTVVRYPKSNLSRQIRENEYGHSDSDLPPVKKETLTCSRTFLGGVVLASHWLFGVGAREDNLDVLDGSGEIINTTVLHEMAPTWIDTFDFGYGVEIEHFDESGEGLMYISDLWNKPEEYPKCVAKFRQMIRKLCTKVAVCNPEMKYQFFFPNLSNMPELAYLEITDMNMFLGMHWGLRFFNEDMKNVEGFLFLGGVEIEDAKGFPEAWASSVEVGRFFSDRFLVAAVVGIVRSYIVGKPC